MRVSHNLIVSQKLKALTSKKWPLYRATQGNVQIVVYKGNYCLGIFLRKVSQHETVGSSTVQRLSIMEGGFRSSACHSIRRDGTVVSPSEDGLHRWGTRRDCKGDVVTQNILRIFSENSPAGRTHDIQGIEPLIQDMLQVQPVSSLEYSHVGQSITLREC